MDEKFEDYTIEESKNRKNVKKPKKDSKEKKKAREQQEPKEFTTQVEERLNKIYPDLTLTKDRVCDIALHCRAELMKRKIDNGIPPDPAKDKNSRQVERNKYVALSYLYRNWDEVSHFIKQIVFAGDAPDSFHYAKIEDDLYGPLETPYVPTNNIEDLVGVDFFFE